MSRQRLTKQKKNFLTTGIALLAISLLASCNGEDTFPGTGSEEVSALGLNALQANDLSEAATRATTTAYPTSKFIGFFVKADAANGYAACNNRKGGYSTARKLWLPDATTPADSIWLNNHDADIAVYAPYDAAHTTAATLDLKACLRPADGSKDIWCKRFTANNKSTGLAPVLEHVYSRFTISLSLDANYKGSAPVDSVSLTNADLYVTGTYKPFEATPYTYAGDAGIGFKLSPVVSLTTAAPTGSIDLLLIPATLTGDIKLSLTVNKITFGVTLSKTSFGGKLEAGKQYNAGIKLKPTALQVTSVTINDWNDETVSGDKEPAFIEGIDIGLDFNISEGNVIATKQADNTFTYAFAEEQGYYSSDKNGDYFCWNTLDPSANGVTQSSWDNTRDICRKIGDGMWYTPSSDQWKEIVGAGYVYGPYKMENGTSTNGMYFGITTPPSPSEQDIYLFLPALGYIADIGKGDAYHSYWSSTLSAPYAYGLYFENNSRPDYNHNFYRYYKFAVRCIRNK